MAGFNTKTTKANGTELDTGTDDAKFATAKALKDSNNIPSVAPGTSGNVLTSNGTDWTSAAASGGGERVIGYDGTWYTYNLPFVSSSWVSLGTWNVSHIAQLQAYNQNSNAHTNILGTEDNGFYKWSDDKNLYIQMPVRVGTNPASTYLYRFGVASDTSLGSSVDRAYFNIDDSGVLTAISEGSTSTSTTISGYTLTNLNMYSIEYTSGSSVKFYVNGNLEATHTGTNIPRNSGGSTTSVQLIYDIFANTAKSCVVGVPVISIEI